ncbi:hypothetical protein R4Y45_05670 [Holzapfeliella sp. He02]|uniref:ABC3 transporter permease protein domain-containing protein n=1 Tax=Holzapfeliella saturejae TaxID=3082953 RepID=A0ABU8SHA2_9LACO
MIFKAALKDLKSNIGYFTVYATAVALAIAVYFFFANLSYNPNYQTIDSNSMLGTYMMSISIIAMLTKFSELVFIILFLIITSILFFKISKNNLAKLLIAGFNKSQVVRFFAIQQFIIHFGALIVGIIIGIISTPLLNLILIRLLGWHNTWSMVLKAPLQETFLTFLVVFGMQFLILTLTTRLLKTPTYFNNYANPKKSEIKRRKLRRSPNILVSFLQLLLLMGIIMSVFQLTRFPVFYAFLSLLFLITFFRWWIFRVLEKKKRKRRANDLKVVVYSQLKRSLSDSSWTAIVIGIINMLAIIGLFIFAYGDNGLAQNNVRINPSEFVTTSFNQAEVERVMRDNNLTIEHQQVMPIKLLYYTNVSNRKFGVISQSSYNQAIREGFLNRVYPATNRPNVSNEQLGAKEITLTDGQFSFILYGFFSGDTLELNLENGRKKAFHVDEWMTNRPKPAGYGLIPDQNIIVSDQDFAQIQSDVTYQVISYNIKPSQVQNYKQTLSDLANDLTNQNINIKAIVENDKKSQLTVEDMAILNSDSARIPFSFATLSAYNSYYKDQVTSSYVLSNIQFILIVFSGLLIIATQVILLLKLNTDFSQNLTDYQSLVKLGNLKSDIKKLVFKYTAYYFLMPTLFVMVYMILLLIPFILYLNFTGYPSFITLCGLVIGFTIVAYYAIYQNYWYLVKQKI